MRHALVICKALVINLFNILSYGLYIYSQNPLIRQSLSHDNMSDKQERRNFEDVTYR